jgi:hypothetical protein
MILAKRLEREESVWATWGSKTKAKDRKRRAVDGRKEHFLASSSSLSSLYQGPWIGGKETKPGYVEHTAEILLITNQIVGSRRRGRLCRIMQVTLEIWEATKRKTSRLICLGSYPIHQSAPIFKAKAIPPSLKRSNLATGSWDWDLYFQVYYILDNPFNHRPNDISMIFYFVLMCEK